MFVSLILIIMVCYIISNTGYENDHFNNLDLFQNSGRALVYKGKVMKIPVRLDQPNKPVE